MSERVTTCKRCGSRDMKTLKVINPDTTEMNMDALMECDDCGLEAVYQIASNYHRNQRKHGLRI